MRQRHLWEPRSDDRVLLDAVRALLNSADYRPFWPLTLRQVYYGLVGALTIENTKGSYKRLGGLITKARLSSRIPWEAIMDNNRDMLRGGGFQDAEQFIRFSQEDFLRGYARNLAQKQPTAIEVWVEKDAVARVVHEVSEEFCLPTVVAKGYSSVSYVNALRDRIEKNIRAERHTLVLYFGDLDPSGWNMLPAMFTTLREEMGVEEEDATYERCALNPAQVTKYKLPRSPDALKDDAWQKRRGDPNKTKGDPRAEAYKAEFGNLAVELDAFKPRQLQDIVRAAIERHTDMDLHERELKQEQKDLKRIEKLKNKVAALLEE